MALLVMAAVFILPKLLGGGLGGGGDARQPVAPPAAPARTETGER